MSDDARATAWLRDFNEYWQQRVRTGEVSSFKSLEWYAIRIFSDWLSQEMAKKDAEVEKSMVSRKDIDDVQVCLACMEAHALRNDRSIDILQHRTGAPLKVCRAAMDRAYDRGLIECGVSLETSWVTDAGLSLMKGRDGGALEDIERLRAQRLSDEDVD